MWPVVSVYACDGGWEASVCVGVCVCRFSACKVGWRGTSAEELLLVTVRDKGKRKKERRKRGMETASLYLGVFFLILSDY